MRTGVCQANFAGSFTLPAIANVRSLGIARTPTIVDPQVVTFARTQLLKGLQHAWRHLLEARCTLASGAMPAF